jgi:hypothetical protein
LTGAEFHLSKHGLINGLIAENFSVEWKIYGGFEAK